MTGRNAYEMFTRAFGGLTDYARQRTQFTDVLAAWDDLGWQEQGAWKHIARQIERRTERSVAARKVSK